MKKFLPIILATVLLIAVLVVCLTMCKSDPTTPEEPSLDPNITEPTEPDIVVSPVMDEKIKVTFENDGVSIGFTKIGMDKVTNNIYKHGLTSETPDEQAVLTELIVTFIDGAPKADDTPHNPDDNLLPDYEEPIQLRFSMLEYNLLSTEDIHLKSMLETTDVDEFWEAFTCEMLAELLRRDYGRYDVMVTGFFDRINGNSVKRGSFEFTAEAEFEDACDRSVIKKVPVTMTNKGATIKFNVTDLLAAMNINKNNLKDYQGLYFRDFCIGVAGSYNDAYMEKTYSIYPNEKLPEELVIEMTYEDAAELNHEFYTQMNDGASGYIWVRMDYKDNRDEDVRYAFFMMDATAKYTVPEDAE